MVQIMDFSYSFPSLSTFSLHCLGIYTPKPTKSPLPTPIMMPIPPPMLWYLQFPTPRISTIHRPIFPTTDPTITATSLSQPFPFSEPRAPTLFGGIHPLITHSRIPSLTLSLLLLSARAETPPLTIISCTLVPSCDARDRQKCDGNDAASIERSNGSSRVFGAFSASSSVEAASSGCAGGLIESSSASNATMF